MNKKEYRLIHRLLRRIDQINGELYEVWTPIAKILLRQELANTHQSMNAIFSKEQIKNARLERQRMKHKTDKYIAHRWIYYQAYERYGHEAEQEVSTIVNRLHQIRFAIHAARNDGNDDGVPF